MKITRNWSMPNSKTFKIKPIQALIKKYIENGNVNIDPFANDSIFRENTVTNDIDPQYETDYNMDALDFLKMYQDSGVDLVLYDPPYSPRQVSEVYKKLGMTVNMKTTQSSYWSKQKKEISRIVKQGGYCITFGWNSGGIGKSNGFEITEIMLVPHGGWHNDTIVTVERKVGDENVSNKKLYPTR